MNSTDSVHDIKFIGSRDIPGEHRFEAMFYIRFLQFLNDG
jgi:hypothetical protein